MNNKIDANLKKTIAEKSKYIYQYMCDLNYGKLSDYFTDSLKKMTRGDFETRFLPQIATVIKGKEYRIYDEFYITNANKDSVIHLSSERGDESYSFDIMSPAKETYVAMLVAGDNHIEVLLTFGYVKLNGEWKLNIIKGEDYSYGGRNALQLFNYAHELRKNGDYIDANNIMSVCFHCAYLVGNGFRFKVDDWMKDFADTLNFENNVKYSFPVTVEQMKTKPQIFNIHYEYYELNLVPVVMYQSNVYRKDTMALKAENDELHEKIGQVFKGLNTYNKTIVYKTNNEKPNTQNSTPNFFTMVKKRD